MSIVNRLKHLFKGENNKEEKDIKADVSNTSNDVEVTSSKTVKKSIPVDETEDSSKDLTFKKDIEPLEDDKVEEETVVEEVSESEDVSSEEIVQEAEAEEADLPIEDEAEPEKAIVEESAEEVEETSEEVDADEVEENSNNKDTKGDNMTLLTDKELLNDSNRDPDFTAEFIDAGIETVKHCFQCGTCSGSCPSGRRTPYKVRQIVRKCLLGLKEEVIADDALWMCTTCYTCQERCLRSVKIVEIIKKARNIAAHAGYMAKPHKMTGVFVMNTGHGVPINDATKALRTKIGLSEIPPTTHAFPEALAEVQKICKITGFDELIGYDEATGGLKE
ncbi:CoB--CoM heterodisulfide reductase subunit C [Methanobrevibacter sp.]|jgi:heterodisulfide reductase subunit C|uniref:CoB--CoM heterodisulfide reductase subunit C n=1 Tax=Methanobrevibacter sp. TaxID=66852 RepID=UPI002E7684A3|nr:CoB--CoM heterodisulfide reductase subunit C [Methanobrevibacter sp.]MEE0939051.1 CoB--CoM heterodisulfide reductase subunit C [Methanobrevibacter sp.]